MRNSTILLLALILFFGGTAIYSSFEFNNYLEPENIELYELPNGVSDRLLNDGTIERNVSNEFVFDGSETWIIGNLNAGSNIRRFYVTSKMASTNNLQNLPVITNSDTFKYYNESYTVLREKVVYGLNNRFFYIYVDTVERFNLPPDSDSITLINAFKSWLSNNNLKVRHQLETPIIESSYITEFLIDYNKESVEYGKIVETGFKNSVNIIKETAEFLKDSIPSKDNILGPIGAVIKRLKELFPSFFMPNPIIK